MIRVVAVVAALCLFVGLVYWQGGKDAGQADRENTLKREKGIGDAINDSDTAPSWRELLHGRK